MEEIIVDNKQNQKIKKSIKAKLSQLEEYFEKDDFSNADKVIINYFNNIILSFNMEELKSFNEGLDIINSNEDYEENKYFSLIIYTLIANIMKSEFLNASFDKKQSIIYLLIDSIGLIDYKDYKKYISIYLNNNFYYKLDYISKKTYISKEKLFISLIESDVDINLFCLDETYNKLAKEEKENEQSNIKTLDDAYQYLNKILELMDSYGYENDFNLILLRFKRFIKLTKSKNNILVFRDYQNIINNLNGNDSIITKFKKLEQFLYDYESINNIDLGYNSEMKR
jgi:hypothetical protein